RTSPVIGQVKSVLSTSRSLNSAHPDRLASVHGGHWAAEFLIVDRGGVRRVGAAAVDIDDVGSDWGKAGIKVAGGVDRHRVLGGRHDPQLGGHGGMEGLCSLARQYHIDIADPNGNGGS